MAIVCNCPMKCEIHPKYDKIEVVRPPEGKTPIPIIDSHDKLQLKTLESESLKAQLNAELLRQQAVTRAQQAHNQLEQFVAAMFDKHSLKQQEWTLDLSKLEFVRRNEDRPNR